MRLTLLASIAAFASLPTATALACGGAVAPSGYTADVDGQRVLLAHRDGQTEIIAQINVPETERDYGILLPVPAEPTIDEEPVPTEELDMLDASTSVFVSDGSSGGGGGGGCGCGLGAADGMPGGLGGSGVSVSDPVDVGPVTAVRLSGEDGSAITDWLNDHDFVIPAEHDALVDSYAGPGRYFVAFKRSEAATTGDPSSVAVHITVPGEHAGYPLRISQMGAAAELSVTVFIASDSSMGPADPFEGLEVGALDAATVGDEGYDRGVADAVRDAGNKAFVIEGVFRRSDLVDLEALGPRLRSLTAGGSGQRITRLSSVFDSSTLDTDVGFVDRSLSEGSRTIHLSVPPSGPGGPREPRPPWLGGFAIALLAGGWWAVRKLLHPAHRHSRVVLGS